jgi:predicted aspartyl protease
MLVLAALLFASSARAESCKLAMVGSFGFTMGESDARVLVDADLGAVKGKLIVDTGGLATMISGDAAAALKVHPHALQHGGYVVGAGGARFNRVGILPLLQIGAFRSRDVHAFINSDWSEKGTIGTIGADFLTQFDVEFDFAGHRMNLFSQDHCPGQVVYWTHDPVAVLPLTLSRHGYLETTVSLDGKPLDTVIDTGSPFSSLTLVGARKLFGITDQSPGFAPVPDWPGHFTYGFKRLEVGDVAFGNPKLHIVAAGGGDDRMFLLGLHELKKLHIFISYKERMLYATPVNAR